MMMMMIKFAKDICPKVNVIARLEYELAYYDSAALRFNHYTTRCVSVSMTFVAASFISSLVS